MAELPRVMGCGCCTGLGGGGGGGQGRPDKRAGARVWKTGFPGFNPLIGVRTATAVNHALTGLGNINGMGFELEEGDYVLARGQTDKTQNGVYAASAGAWTKVTAGYDRLLIQVWEGNQAGWYLSSIINGEIVIQLSSGTNYARLFGREVFGGPEFVPADPAAPWRTNSTLAVLGVPFLNVFGSLKADLLTVGTVSAAANSYEAAADGADIRGPYTTGHSWDAIDATTTAFWWRRSDTTDTIHQKLIEPGSFALSSNGLYYVARTQRNLLTDLASDPSADAANWFLTNASRMLPVRIESAPPFARYRRWRETSVVTCPDGASFTAVRGWVSDWQGTPRHHTFIGLEDWSKMGVLTAPPAPPSAASIGAIAIAQVNLSVPDETIFEFPAAGRGLFVLISESAGGTTWRAELKVKQNWFLAIGGPQGGQHYAEYLVTQTVEVSDPITDAEVEAKWQALVPASLNEQPWGFYQFLSYWSDGTVRTFPTVSFSITPVIGSEDASHGFYGFPDSYVEGGILQRDV